MPLLLASDDGTPMAMGSAKAERDRGQRLGLQSSFEGEKIGSMREGFEKRVAGHGYGEEGEK